MTALNLALATQRPVRVFYFVLSAYLNVIGERHRRLELGQRVLAVLETYPEDKLAGRLRIDFAHINSSKSTPMAAG